MQLYTTLIPLYTTLIPPEQQLTPEGCSGTRLCPQQAVIQVLTGILTVLQPHQHGSPQPCHITQTHPDRGSSPRGHRCRTPPGAPTPYPCCWGLQSPLGWGRIQLRCPCRWPPPLPSACSSWPRWLSASGRACGLCSELLPGSAGGRKGDNVGAEDGRTDHSEVIFLAGRSTKPLCSSHANAFRARYHFAETPQHCKAEIRTLL